MAQLESQIEVNKAQANKLNADAIKTAGIDTELSKAEKSYKESLKALTENQATGATWDWQLKKSQIENLIQNTKLANENTKKTAADATVAENTIKSRTQEVLQGINESYSRQLLNQSQGKVNNAVIENIQNTIKQRWAEISQGERKIVQGWRNIENESQKITNDLNLGEKGLDIQQQRLVKEWVTDGIDAIIP